jgi:hypothetical protein
MKRLRVLACALGLVLLAAGPASSAGYFGFTVGVANAPRPPVIALAAEPHVLLASDAMVYVMDDAAVRFDGDLFRYGQYWFAYTSGYWYRARSHQGPYTVIEVHKVPRAILGVPRRLWKHHPLAIAPGRAANAGSVARVTRVAHAKATNAGSVADGKRVAQSKTASAGGVTDGKRSTHVKVSDAAGVADGKRSAHAKPTNAGSVAGGKRSTHAKKAGAKSGAASRTAGSSGAFIGPPAPVSARMYGPLADAGQPSASAPAAPETRRSPRGSAR